MQLVYNSWHPLDILEGRAVKKSILDKRDRGVSMSSNLGLWCHGPFKFVFKPDRTWYAQFTQCIYGGKHEFGADTRIYKQDFFADEEEWWSPESVVLELEDIQMLVFMSDSPGKRIHPVICNRRWKEVQKQFGKIIHCVEDKKHYPPPGA